MHTQYDNLAPFHPCNNGTPALTVINVVSIYSKVAKRNFMRLLRALSSSKLKNRHTYFEKWTRYRKILNLKVIQQHRFSAEKYFVYIIVRIIWIQCFFLFVISKTFAQSCQLLRFFYNFSLQWIMSNLIGDFRD